MHFTPFFTTPKSFPQHISLCRSVAISIPLVRLRCSEQRITGVVNKTASLLAAAALMYSYLSKKKAAILSQVSPSLNEPKREVVRSLSSHFAAFARKDTFSKCEYCKNWQQRENICLHSNAGVMRVGEGIRCDERSSKTRSGLSVLTGNGASSARHEGISFPLSKHLHILYKHCQAYISNVQIEWELSEPYPCKCAFHIFCPYMKMMDMTFSPV